ncbi:MAG: [protein-PII] uridylyltransferase [Pseudoxanthomonas suwonensis]|nr:[protein-PII] uridylyltransferase [Pseudoxanthomonas suwonensis]
MDTGSEGYQRQRQDDQQWSQSARTQLLALSQVHAERFDAGEHVDRLQEARAKAIDALVLGAWQRCFDGVQSPPALFAVGGYGRGLLAPFSDIDLLVLAEPQVQQQCAARVARFITLLWDSGLETGHAVRSLAQTVQATSDVTVMTALLEARQLAGDPALTAALREAIDPARVWPPHDYYLAKRDELRERHARFGDTADNLEPNLKEGPGGLRDVQTLRWMALRVAGQQDLESLSALGQLGADEYLTVQRERQHLARLRYGLHLVAGKREERLRFDYQKALATRLGFVDKPGQLAVEQMMQGFYRGAALVQRIGDRLMQRFEEQLQGEAVAEPLDALFALRRGYLSARDASWPNTPAEIFALFACWARLGELQGLHSQSARALAEALDMVPAYDEADDDLRAAFMALLRGPTPVRTLERMARLGVLGRWLPAFSRVSGRMQFDLFHMYTVDQHTLAVLRNLAGFAAGPDERFSIAHDVRAGLRKPELLLLGALFHDIAKGRGGDHSRLGADEARHFCLAMGLSTGDTELVSWLVEQHLLMSSTAQKQDIADPEVIHRFASIVADRERLDYLYLLTCADIAGTSPKLWNAWKDRLLADLHTATRLALRRGLENPVAAVERIAETRAATREILRAHGVTEEAADALFLTMPEDGFLRGHPEQVAWQANVLSAQADAPWQVAARRIGHDPQAGELEVFVCSPDRDGLFAAIVATLDRAGLAIQHARLLRGPQGRVFDTFQVLPLSSRYPVAPAQVEARLREVLQQRDLDQVRPPRRTQPRHLQHFRIRPQVAFAESAAGHRTLLSLVCTDRPGLLADVARLLRDQGLRVHDARIATFGERAEDMFQITDQNDNPLSGYRQDALRDGLLETVPGDRP